jgi:molybdopterin/thiamine biosynthesis adenylyltransferase
VVLDCSDNFATRHLINAACVRHGKPLVSGAAIRFDGQISVYDTRDENLPVLCLRFPARCRLRGSPCATMGVFAPVVGIIGTMQAAEALKLLSGAGPSLTGRLLMLDARAMEWTEVRVARNRSTCRICATRKAATAARAGTTLP